MNTEQILMCVVALILGMLLANMLKSVCGCKNLIEGQIHGSGVPVVPICTCDNSQSTCNKDDNLSCRGTDLDECRSGNAVSSPSKIPCVYSECPDGMINLLGSCRPDPIASMAGR